MQIFIVDAFTDRLFSGNPAAVVPLKDWLSDSLMQQIASENNLSETAFFVNESEGCRIRWFTPIAEVKLCGHATLASAHVLFNHLGYNSNEITFNSLSGPLTVTRKEKSITLNFPADFAEEVAPDSKLISCFSIKPLKVLKGKTDYLLVYENQDNVENVEVDYKGVAAYKARGVIVSAPGKEHDFVSRFFAPLHGIDEDPVTGSAHTILTPYWAKQLGKSTLNAKQLSQRGGELICELIDNRVNITGTAVTYMTGALQINN